MGTTHRNNLNPTKLREEYGPAPWWSRDHLRELIEDHGLRPAEIARVWGVSTETIRDWADRHELREAAA